MPHAEDNRLILVQFTVRPTRTLVSTSVSRGVGGPSSGLWRGWWSIGLGARDVAARPLHDQPMKCMLDFVTDENIQPMSYEHVMAWQKSWRTGGAQ